MDDGYERRRSPSSDLAIWLDAVLKAVELPAGVARLDAALADVDGDNLTHVEKEEGRKTNGPVEGGGGGGGERVGVVKPSGREERGRGKNGIALFRRARTRADENQCIACSVARGRRRWRGWPGRGADEGGGRGCPTPGTVPGSVSLMSGL